MFREGLSEKDDIGSEGVRLRKNGLACSSQRTVYADGKEVGT